MEPETFVKYHFTPELSALGLKQMNESQSLGPSALGQPDGPALWSHRC